MQTKTYNFIDKKNWGDGPWQTEPDKKQWQDEATGLPCLITRHAVLGHLCGYVGVAAGHPLFGKDPGEDDVDLYAHGGVNFADLCQPSGDEANNVCHVPDPGEPDKVWWFGFDCAHGFDATPGTRALLPADMPQIDGVIYRDFAYVEDQCAKLAAQLHWGKAS